MYKIYLRLKTLFPAIIGTRDKHSDIEFRVIAENGIDIDKNAVITVTDVADDIYGVENIYAYKDCIIIEVKRDPDEDDFYDDDCSTDEDDAIFDYLNTCYSKSRNKTEIIIVYHYKDNKPLQSQFYLDGDKTMLTNEEILREINDSL